MVFTDVFTMLGTAASKTTRYVSLCGGTRSGKTFSVLQLLYLISASDTKKTVTSVVSETFPHLKRGAIRDFQGILGSDWDERCWSKSESVYTFPSGAMIEFFSADNPGKVHGPARDRLFINEANHISYETFRQLAVRTRDIVFLDYNPTHSFWLNERVEQLPECITIHSTYKNNKNRDTGASMLSDAQIREIESNRGDENWWRVYGEGKIGQLEGLIFPNFEQIDHLPDVGNMAEAYGQDYGYSCDPSTMIRLLFDSKARTVYADEVYYRKGMLNADMAAAMADYGVRKRSVPIYGDCAEPKTIADLCTYGYNVKPCIKSARKAEQLNIMKGYTLKVTKRSVNLIRELRGYTWQTDKDGNSVNEPIGFNDHAIDAMRYGFMPLVTVPKQRTTFSNT